MNYVWFFMNIVMRNHCKVKGLQEIKCMRVIVLLCLLASSRGSVILLRVLNNNIGLFFIIAESLFKSYW